MPIKRQCPENALCPEIAQCDAGGIGVSVSTL